jgi:hypothetical protein
MRASFYLIALWSAGCLRATEYRCTSSDQCGTGGTCQTSGYCSFADSSCGQRYGAQAGPYADQCVGGGGGLDAGTDAFVPGDAANHCPSSFTTIAGGTPGHRYKAQPATQNWQLQVNACIAQSTFAYLAIPDDATELAALDTLAGGASATYWVGIDDLTTEGTFLTVKNAPATFLPWDPPAPDDAGPGEDCVEAVTALAKFNDQRCNMQLPAICECE